MIAASIPLDEGEDPEDAPTLTLSFIYQALDAALRGQGVMLQKYRDGGLSDATTFVFAEGLSWAMGGDTGRTRTETDLGPWRVARSASGRMPPTGFPRNNRFD